MKRTSSDHAFTAQELKGTRQEPTFSGALSFLRRRYTRDLAGVDVAVTGIPLDTATTSRPGARYGPRGIRLMSSQIAWARPYGCNFDPLEKLAVVDYGDCVWDHGRPAEIPAAIEAHADAIIATGAAMLSMGGDHFVSYPLLKAHAKRHGPLSLIHFDAHSDTWNDADGAGRVDHGTMFYHAVREGIVDPGRSVQIGLRTHNDDLMGFNVLDAPWVHEHGAAAVASEARRIVGRHKAYLTFDIDCLDPCFAPGTGTPVAGGLSSAQAFAILKGLAGIDFVGMDIVEVAPPYDVADITALAAAHIAHEWLALYAVRPGGPAA
ncbi:MAG TPA: agmatinase [Steroidobacteraceae bacterium]|jgi:agmatinase|nr:agmatinase [Steroidobacteraceae bacterium]